MFTYIFFSRLQFSLRRSRSTLVDPQMLKQDTQDILIGFFKPATASIVSGGAERIKIWPFFIFSAIMAGIIYPISMGWQWGGGWLAALAFLTLLVLH